MAKRKLTPEVEAEALARVRIWRANQPKVICRDLGICKTSLYYLIQADNRRRRKTS